MAVTKIWDIKARLSAPIDYVQNEKKTENPNFTKEQMQSLGDVMSYAENEEKTEKHFYVTGINCNPQTARDQFITVKQQFDKEGGIVAFHGYQSFAPNEASPDIAHEIGVKLAKELWGDKFQVIVATHLNTKCLHNHFVLNSVSFRDGKRYHDCKSTYFGQMRKASDRLCKEYGLTVVEKPQRNKDPSYLHRSDTTGMPTRYNVARTAIDEAISKSCNMREVEQHLKEMGYKTQFNSSRKYWTVTPLGWNKPIRIARLGEEYTNERIYERVISNPSSVRLTTFQSKQVKVRQYVLVTRKDKINKVGGLRGLYLKYCYELGYLPKYKQSHARTHYLLRDDLMKLDLLSKEIQLISRQGFETTEDVSKHKMILQSKIAELTNSRADLRNVMRRKIPEKDRDEIKTKIYQISKELKNLRYEVKLCSNIAERSGSMNEKIEKVEAEKNKEREMIKR